MPSTALRVHPSLIVADSYVEAITGDASFIKDEGVAARYALTTRPVAEIQQHGSSSTSSSSTCTNIGASSNVAAEVLYNGASGLGQVLCSLLLFADGDGADTVTLPNGAVWSEMAGTVFASSTTSATSASPSTVVGTTASSPAAGNRDVRTFLSSLLETNYSPLSQHSPVVARRPIFKIEEGAARKHLVPHVQVSGSMLGRALSLAGGIHEMWKNVFTNKHQHGHSVLDQLAAAIAGAGTELAVADVLGRMLAYREGLGNGEDSTAAADSIAHAHEAQRRAWQVCAGEVLPHLNLLLLSVGGSGGIQDVVPVRMLVEACWSLLVPLSFLAAVRQDAQSLESKGVVISVVQSAVVRLIVGTFDPHRSGISNPIPSEFNVPLGTYMLLTSLSGKEFITIAAPGGTTQRVPVSPLLSICQTNTELQLADLTVVHQMLGRTVSGAKEPWRMLLTSSVPPPPSSNHTNTTTASEMDEGADAGSPIRRLRAQLDASIDVVDATSSPTVGSPTTANPSLGCLRDREEKKALQKLLGNSRQIRDEAATMLAPYLYSISGLGLHDLNAGSPILPNRGAGQRKSESHGAGSQSVASAEASRSRSGVGMRGRLSGGGGGLPEIGERRSRGEEVGGGEDGTADKRLRFEAGSPLSVGRNSGVLGTSPNVMPSIEVGGTPLPPLDLLRRQSILGDRLPPPPPMFSAFLTNKGTAPPMEVTLDDGANERARVFMSSVFGDAITSSLPISAICDLERFAVNSALIALREQLHNEGADSVLSPIDHLLTYVTEENGDGPSLDLTSRVAVVALLEACMRLERHSQPDSSSTSLYLPEDVAAGSSFVSGPVVHYCRNAVQPLVDDGVNASALTPMLVLLIQSTVNAFIRSGMPRLCGMCGLLPLHSPLSYSPLSDITAPTDSNVRCGGSKGRISRAIRTAAGLGRIRDSHLGKEASSGLVAETTAALKEVGISLADVRTSQSGRSAASLLGGTEGIPVTEGNLLTEAIQFYASRGADTEVALSRIRMQCCGSEQCSACAAFDTCRLCGEMDLVPTSTLTALSAHSLTATSSSSLIRLCELDAKEIKARVDSLAEGAKGVDAIQGRSLLLLDTLFFNPSEESLLISPGL